MELPQGQLLLMFIEVTEQFTEIVQHKKGIYDQKNELILTKLRGEI
ncbi:hypothetical protein [Paenibacillus ginsengarvi]|nr:hypothetical protein [Paenibacillus ginsengarvi]